MENNNVNHPKHYTREGGMECIDEMLLIFGKEAVKIFVCATCGNIDTELQIRMEKKI